MRSARHCAPHGIAPIRLATPTTDAARLPAVLDGAGGFLYYVSVAGITGKQQAAQAAIEEAVARLKASTDLPIAVGFGVRTPEQAAAIARVADGVVVGSAIVEIVAQHGADAAAPVRDYIRIAQPRYRAPRTAEGTPHELAQPRPQRHALRRQARDARQSLAQVQGVRADGVRQGVGGQSPRLPEVRASRPHRRRPRASRMLFDDGDLRKMLPCPSVPEDPLKFRDTKKYVDRLKAARADDRRAAMRSSTPLGRIDGHKAVVGVQDFAFMGGSMGLAVGEAFIAGTEARDRATKCPIS